MYSTIFTSYLQKQEMALSLIRSQQIRWFTIWFTKTENNSPIDKSTGKAIENITRMSNKRSLFILKSRSEVQQYAEVIICHFKNWIMCNIINVILEKHFWLSLWRFLISNRFVIYPYWSIIINCTAYWAMIPQIQLSHGVSNKIYKAIKCQYSLKTIFKNIHVCIL